MVSKKKKQQIIEDVRKALNSGRFCLTVVGLDEDRNEIVNGLYSAQMSKAEVLGNLEFAKIQVVQHADKPDFQDLKSDIDKILREMLK